jgi:hypothetical protein
MVLDVCLYNTAYGPSLSFPKEFCIAHWGVDPSSKVARRELGRLVMVYGFLAGCSLLIS